MFPDAFLHLEHIGSSRRECAGRFAHLTIRQMSIRPPKKSSIKKSTRWHLYILKCSDNTFYTGMTSDLQRRLKMHNDGKASRYTRCRLPVIIIYQERCLNKSSALKKEYKMKSLTRKEKEQYILKKSKTPVS